MCVFSPAETPTSIRRHQNILAVLRQTCIIQFCVSSKDMDETEREQAAERTDCAATQSNLLGLGDGRHLSLGPLVDSLVDGVDESQEGALLLKVMMTLVVE